MNTTIDVDALCSTSKKFKYYGANCNQLKLGKVIYEVVEDEEDGYRSSMKELAIVDVPTGIFYNRSLATVFVRGNNQIYELVDVKDGYVWLTFGTDNVDEYYPCFVFDPHPRAA